MSSHRLPYCHTTCYIVSKSPSPEFGCIPSQIACTSWAHLGIRGECGRRLNNVGPTVIRRNCVIVRLQTIRNITRSYNSPLVSIFFAVIIILKEIDVFRTYNVGPMSHQRKTSTYSDANLCNFICRNNSH